MTWDVASAISHEARATLWLFAIIMPHLQEKLQYLLDLATS